MRKVFFAAMNLSNRLLNRSLGPEIAQRCGLYFARDLEEGNVCFLTNNAELQDAYKEFFSLRDLVYFVYGVLSDDLTVEKKNSLLGLNSTATHSLEVEKFWFYVKSGQKLAKQTLYQRVDAIENSDGYTELHTPSSIEKNKDGNIGGNVWKDEEKYFEYVRQEVWDFCLSGFFPAQKWSKESRKRERSTYRSIIIALFEIRVIVVRELEIDDDIPCHSKSS